MLASTGSAYGVSRTLLEEHSSSELVKGRDAIRFVGFDGFRQPKFYKTKTARRVHQSKRLVVINL